MVGQTDCLASPDGGFVCTPPTGRGCLESTFTAPARDRMVEADPRLHTSLRASDLAQPSRISGGCIWERSGQVSISRAKGLVGLITVPKYRHPGSSGSHRSECVGFQVTMTDQTSLLAYSIAQQICNAHGANLSADNALFLM